MKRCSAELEAFLSQRTDLAPRDDADVMRRYRAFGLIGFVLLFVGCVVAGLEFGLGAIQAALLLSMILVALTIWAVGVQSGRFARLATHISLGFTMAVLTAGVVRIGASTSLNILVPSLLVLTSCHILGVRAAAGWTVAALGSLAVAIYASEPGVGDTLSVLNLRFMARGIALFGFFAIAAAGREVADSRAREIEFLARHDSLTGILNRWEFEQHLADAIARSRRYKHSVALIFIDLDRFKEVNDTHGHLAGDMVLKAAAQRISEITRETDSAARAGGDEFLVLLDAVTGEEAAVLCASRLIEALSEPIYVTGVEIQLNASAGIALYPADGDDVIELTSAADQAMYDAKRTPSSSVQLYSAIGS